MTPRRTSIGAARSGRAGLTLIEILVALMIAGLLVLLLGQMLRGTRASAAAVDRALDPLQVLDLAAELLTEEIGLAGHLGWPEPAVVADLPPGSTPTSFIRPGLDLVLNVASDAVTVRYIDDRLVAGPLARVVTFEAGRDSAGEPQLFRRAGASSRQPLVAGVESLRVVALVSSGSELAPTEAPAEPLRAIVLRLAASGSYRDVVIELLSRPVLGVTP